MAIEIERTAVIEAVQPAMRWGAVIAGWLVAVGIAFLLYVAGLAMGFSAFDPNDSDATAKGIGMATAAWMLLTWVVSLFIGGLFASWFDGREDPTTGVMHGVTVWGLSIAASGLVLALGVGGAIGSGASIAGGALGGMQGDHMGHMGHGMHGDASQMLQAQLMQRVRQSGASDATAMPAPSGMAPPTPASTMPGAAMPDVGMPTHRDRFARLDPRSANAVTMALLANHADTARAVLAANTDMSQADVDSTIQAMSTQASQARASMKASADAAAHYTAMAMWVLVISLLLSLLAAALGGWLGASHVHRVYHLRRYSRSVPLR